MKIHKLYGCGFKNCISSEILLKMKLTFVLFIAVFLQVNAEVYSQKITLSQKDAQLEDVFKQIMRQTDYHFLYDSQKLKDAKPVSVELLDAGLTEALEQCFSGQPFTYIIDNSTVIVKMKEVPTPPVTGKVVDQDGKPMPFVSIAIKGTSQGVTSDENGDFSIVAPKGQVLVFSFIGYIPQEITVGDSQVINVILLSGAQQIEGIVVTAQVEGQRNAIRQQINSNTLKNVVAADRLQENPDANATEAIGRLPGISVIRSGGEGTGLVIRGLEPRYSSVTLNGVQLPSTSGSDRGTNLNGISQYALQGAEVYKSLTADMDANSVAGTINLKLRKAPNNLHVNVMAQRGYNHLNNYWGNYKYLGEFSNRYFNNKLGVLFTANLERVNRSTQSMSAGYKIETNKNPDDPIMLQSINLNDISTILTRRSTLLSLDYEVNKNTTLMLYGMYTYSGNKTQNQTKSYGLDGAGSVGYNFSSNPDNETKMLQSSLSGETKIKFLKIIAEYGIGYSKGKNVNDNGRSWNFLFEEASSSANTTPEIRKMYPSDVIPLFHDDQNNLSKCWLTTIGSNNSNISDENMNAYLNFAIPVKISEQISGNIKIGGMHRTKKHFRDDQVGSQSMASHQNVYAPAVAGDSLDWMVKTSRDNISAIGISTDNTTEFLNGTYNFGNKFDFNRLNEISDNWENVSDFYYLQGPSVYLPVFGGDNKVGYAQDMGGCILNDQNIKENYNAGYLMTEINFGKYVMFLPGVRFETTHTTMHGFYAMPPTLSPNLKAPLSGYDTSAVRSDQYVLPMIHLRIKPTNSFFVHLAFTQTLSRPDFNSINPNYYVNAGWFPFSYIAGNPLLKNERWNNFDAQLTYHNNKLGLLSVTGFYKEVKDKIWQRSYARIKGDPLITPFPDAALVNVSLWENHPYTAYVKGIELDWQSSFSYLPKPFSFLTLSANYTYTYSETTYPYTILLQKTPPGGGKPIQTRLDSVTTGPMLFQPKNIANISLGFNKKGFNTWFSFQYNGQIFTGKNYKGVPRLDSEKEYFYRYDLQVTQKFAIGKIKGFEVLVNIANLSNFTEKQKSTGDPRPTYAESYGWTADLGFRFRF